MEENLNKYSREELMAMYENSQYLLDNSIPISVIKKKIEELGGMKEIGDIPREMYNRIEYAIEILLEILEERSRDE